MLNMFIDNLKDEFPEAKLDLARPALDIRDVRARLDDLCTNYAEASGCLKALDDKEDYILFSDKLASILKVKPEEMRSAIELGITATVTTGATIALLMAAEASHAAGAGDAAMDIAAHGIDISEAAATFGISVLLSFGASILFNRINKEKKGEVDSLSEIALLKARLAKLLMSPDKIEKTTDTLRRIKECRLEMEGI